MSLPNWFILKTPPDLNLDIPHWKKFALDRIKLLEALPKNPSRVIHDSFPHHDVQLHRIYENYLLGAYLLRLVAATNRRLEAWLIESEGDLFQQLYFDRVETPDERVRFFEAMFGSENVMSYNDFKTTMDEAQNPNLAQLYEDIHFGQKGRSRKDFVICVHFTQVPWMVANRRGYLRKGWVISSETRFRGSLKKAFEGKLQHEIQKAQNLLGLREDIDQAVQEIEQQLAQHVQIRSQFGGIELEGHNLHTNPEVFPPCMAYLTMELDRSGRLTHVHRLQLGFFLKKIGMSLDEQLHYWYEKSVDNVGVSFSSYQRRAGYQIRHLYGLEGGRKDYHVPKCSTIATGYFCPFVHLSPDLLTKYLKAYALSRKNPRTIADKQVVRIVGRSASDPTRACTWFFHMIHGRHTPYKIVHPLQWIQAALQLASSSGDETRDAT